MQPLEQGLLDDFRNFSWWLWAKLGLPAPTVVQYDIAQYLQHGPRRRMIQAFRGVGKSWITAAYVIWRLLKDPNERILVVSASKDRADSFSIFVKRLINEIPELQLLRPRRDQRDSNIAFDVGPSTPHQSPSVRSVGITGQLTGGRASIIIADDIEVPKNSLTHAQREKLAELVKEFDAILMSAQDLAQLGMSKSEVIYLGTPQTEMSLYNALPSRGYEVRIWPARFKRETFNRYGEKLAPMLAKLAAENSNLFSDCTGRGAPTDPQRFDDMDLMEREASYGRSGFALQFMLDTTVSDADRYPLKLSDLVVTSVAPDVAPVKIAWGSSPEQLISNLPVVGLAGDRLYRPMFVHKDFAPYTGVVMAVDPSGRGGDELAYAVVAMLNGFLYVLTVGGLKNGYSDTNLETLARVAKRYQVKHVIVEENFGDGMFTKLLTPFLVRIHPVTTEEIKHSTQKERRIIDTLEPVMNQHRLVVPEELIKADAEVEEPRFQLFYQMTRITKERGALAKDDRLDVLAMAVQYWVEQMDRDVQTIEKDHRAALMDAEIERFMRHQLGVAPSGPTWFSTGH